MADSSDLLTHPEALLAAADLALLTAEQAGRTRALLAPTPDPSDGPDKHAPLEARPPRRAPSLGRVASLRRP